PLKTLYRTNLPVPPTPFIGRERELADVTAFLANGVSVLTLTGAGGTGKTRLGLQAVAEVADRFPGGVVWGPRAPLRDCPLVATAFAAALGVSGQQERDLVDALADNLAGRRALVLVDNAEHLLPAVATVVGRLRDADGPKVVITSRER